MALADIEASISQINSSIDSVSAEVSALIAKVQAGTGGLTADEAAQVNADLQAALAKLQSIPDAP